MYGNDLLKFVAESNRIEGIDREPTDAEMAVHDKLLSLSVITIADMEAFVSVVAPGKVLRRKPYMNVRVGNHIAPPGGVGVVNALDDILVRASDRHESPYLVHQAYEHLHPFMDGNGRSGRMLWLWMMYDRDEYVLQRGFLHTWYYQSLSAWRSQDRSARVTV